jgi:hypothetical protein
MVLFLLFRYISGENATKIQLPFFPKKKTHRRRKTARKNRLFREKKSARELRFVRRLLLLRQNARVGFLLTFFFFFFPYYIYLSICAHFVSPTRET